VRRNERQWRLTDFQRLAVVLAGASAIFLTAMSLGMGELAPFLVALLIAVSTGVGVFLLGLRYSARAVTPGTAHVIRAQPRPVGTIVGRCDMEVYVDAPGVEATRVAHREAAVPIIKWPHPGMVLPIEVAARNPRQFRVRWDLVVPHHTRPSKEAEEEVAFAAPFFTEFGPAVSDDFTSVDEELLDHHEHLPYTDFADGYSGLDDDEYGDDGLLDRGSVRAPASPSSELDRLLPPAPGPEADPDTIDGEIIEETFSLDEADASEPSAASGADGSTTATAPKPAAASETAAAPKPAPEPTPEHPLASRPIPSPRLADANGVDGGSRKAAGGSATGGNELRVGLMLFVSDLPRSLRFYRDLLKFTVTDHNASSAVLTYGGGRVVLRRVVDMSPVDRRVVHLHLDVPDVDAAYQELKANGVEFVHRPRVMTRSDRAELWTATFRDPDGHAIAVTQWRERSATP